MTRVAENAAVLRIVELEKTVLSGRDVTREDALYLTGLEGMAAGEFRAAAGRIREAFRGGEARMCAIVNAKSGRCGEDCAFCSQSVRAKTEIDEYPLMSPEEIERAAREAKAMGATRFGIVTAWKGLNDDANLEKICEALRRVTALGLQADASLGLIRDPAVARKLKEAGLVEFNHNLETAGSHYDRICSTHSHEDRLNTLRVLREAGIKICCGGIFGMGESPEQRVEFAFEIKEQNAETVPLNFLHVVPGTALEDRTPLAPEEILNIIALFRFVLPETELKVAGGREINLGDRQDEIFQAGADSIIVGNYLTTKGRTASDDLEMIRRAGLRVAAN